MEDPSQIYQLCLAEIEAIAELFEEGTRRFPASTHELARDRLKTLKRNWEARIKEHRGTDVERTISEALSRIRVTANSRPGQKWLNDLNEARMDLEHYLNDTGTGNEG